MPDITSPLHQALTDAIAFARAHGVETPLTPGDFGIQRSDAGLTHATYIGDGHVVTVLVDRHGHGSMAVGEVDWIHDTGDEDRPGCEDCGECMHCGAPREACECEPFDDTYLGVPLTDVYLPGDAPEAVSTDA
ncbi:hypothetical protein [Nocardia wallacei]|uniref:hypothetical protein n=1 Tax=Nocardia wallacei TaxID=480035 RepID=UPI002453B60B|nr:hypothetical protein [Nocardia wallacei]